MRCFTYDNGRIEPGFRFHGLNGIKVADQLLRFDESLIFSPGSHFGQHIVGASLVKDGDRYVLAAPAEKEGNTGALLLIRTTLSVGSEVSFTCIAGAQPIVGQRCSRLSYSSDHRWRFFVETWEALIELPKGGEISLLERITKRQGFFQMLRNFDAEEVFTRSFCFRFDGETITCSLSLPEGSQPMYRPLSLGMYDEAETIHLIAEMIGNQDRFN